MLTYYNDNEPYVCEWLKNLQLCGPLSLGDVECAPIQSVEAWQLAAYTRCHFFAGLGGWDYALQLAGWPEDRPVWTGSCPCQPFSVAGKRKGTNDERHLWPYFFELIKQCRPATIFGEQVASADGRKWLAGVFADLESLGYAVAGADLCAAGVGAPHIRQRLYWVADTERDTGGVGRTSEQSREGVRAEATGTSVELGRRSDVSGLVIPESKQMGLSRQPREPRTADSRLGNSNHKGLQGRSEHIGEYANQLSAWAPSELIPCADGKARRIEPGTFPLARGVSARVGKLRAYGNAIVPQVAATFIRAFLEI